MAYVAQDDIYSKKYNRLHVLGIPETLLFTGDENVEVDGSDDCQGRIHVTWETGLYGMIGDLIEYLEGLV